MKVYCFVDGRTEDGQIGLALSEEGAEIARAEHKQTDMVSDLLRDACIEKGFTPGDIFWSDDPKGDSEVIAARTAQATAEAEGPASAMAASKLELRTMRAAGEHLCVHCSHCEVCALSCESDRLGACLSACSSFEPVPPPELVQALRGLSRGGTGAPGG